MAGAPTPDPHDLHGYLEKVDRPVLLLADCRGNIEKQVMERWLQGQARVPGVELQTQTVTVDLAGQAAAAALLEHRARDLPDDTLVIPLRVLWLPAKDHSHRLRDLLLGNPHNPGWLKQKLILHFTPDRCCPVYGEAATLGELRVGFADSGAGSNLGQRRILSFPRLLTPGRQMKINTYIFSLLFNVH